MALSEFDLIRQYFATATPSRDDVLLGIGDDCALLRPPRDRCVAVSIDTLVEGRHFLAGTDPEALGHKALAVNLSDLAATGAEPAWATLALTLPAADGEWLHRFMRGFAALAAQYRLQLVGGDTTRGPRSITVQVHGFVDPARALRRSGGRPGDRLFVSGRVGDAGLALQYQSAGTTAGYPDADYLQQRLDRPTPRVALGRLLAGRASAAIDISDGLVADLGHVCEASGCGACIELDCVPLSAPLRALAEPLRWQCALGGGDDYELLFSIPAAELDWLHQACDDAGHEIRQIGRLVDGEGIRLIYPDGRQTTEIPDGFDHFLG